MVFSTKTFWFLNALPLEPHLIYSGTLPSSNVTRSAGQQRHDTMVDFIKGIIFLNHDYCICSIIIRVCIISSHFYEYHLSSKILLLLFSGFKVNMQIFVSNVRSSVWFPCKQKKMSKEEPSLFCCYRLIIYYWNMYSQISDNVACFKNILWYIKCFEGIILIWKLKFRLFEILAL